MVMFDIKLQQLPDETDPRFNQSDKYFAPFDPDITSLVTFKEGRK